MDIQNIFLPACVIDPKNKSILSFNDAFDRFLGYKEDILGQEFLALVTPTDFSLAMGVLSSLSERGHDVFVSFSLLCADGKKLLMNHGFSFRDEQIVNVMVPSQQNTASLMERALLDGMPKPILCLNSAGDCIYANAVARDAFEIERVPFHPDWASWETVLKNFSQKKSFSQWLKILDQEGVFAFYYLPDEKWLVEYQSGREEVFQELLEIIRGWEVPVFLIDGRKENDSLFWNEKVMQIGVSPRDLAEEAQRCARDGTIVSVIRPNQGFSYYRPIVLPVHVEANVFLAALIDETDHHRKGMMWQRLKDTIENLIAFTESMQKRLNRGVIAFFEAYNLSEREQKLITWIQQGLSNDDIAKNLFVSVDTVKKHISQLYRKLSINTRIELLQLMYGSNFKKTPPKG